MSGPPRVRSAHIATEMEARSVLGPAGNKVPVKPAAKSIKKPEKPVQQFSEGKDGEKDKELLSPQKETMPALQSLTLTASILRQQERKVGNLSMSLSCLSDGGASSSSTGSSSSGKTGRGGRRGVGIGVGVRRKQSESKGESGVMVVDSGEDGCLEKKKSVPSSAAAQICLKAYTKASTDVHVPLAFSVFFKLLLLYYKHLQALTALCSLKDLCYVAFHDEEWGVPVHDDKKLFELLSLSGALAEMTWPTILSKRHMFRETFLEFDPRAVSKLSEKKIGAPGSPASSLLSELKIRAIIENARQICKVKYEFGSFDKYIWSFVNHKPMVGQFRYARQVPVKSSKSEAISKDLIRRGFRSVGPTVVYSFMQVAGLTNDHVMSCFRFQECMTGVEARGKVNNEDEANDESRKLEETSALG
ncbi:hypothetical protein V6N13_119623 [Hibiscus sabdariffa]